MRNVKTKIFFANLFIISWLFQPSEIFANADNVLCNGTGVRSAIGCIPVGDSQQFTEYLLRWGMSIGGGIALLLIGYGGFMVITAGGNPQKVQAGKELITASLAGLLFIIFSAFLLRLVGIDVLGIVQLGA